MSAPGVFTASSAPVTHITPLEHASAQRAAELHSLLMHSLVEN